MVTFRTKKLMVTMFAAVSLLFVANGATAELQAAEVKQPAGSKSHKLPATLETTQWGWLDPNEPPKLTVDSGDTVSIETMMHSHNKIQPGTTMEEIVALRKAKPGKACQWHRPQRPRAAERRVQRFHGAGVNSSALEERLEHGSERAPGRKHHLHSGLSQGRARMDRRLALSPGKRRGQPHGS